MYEVISVLLNIYVIYRWFTFDYFIYVPEFSIGDFLQNYILVNKHKTVQLFTLYMRYICIQSLMRGAIHHTVNHHQWTLGDGVGPAECDHGPLPPNEERDKPWLVPNSPAHVALRKVLLDKTWLNNAAAHYSNFR